MTEYNKIIRADGDLEPAPDGAGEVLPDLKPARSARRSSVERAVEGFDLSRLGGIVLPADGRSRLVMREVSIEPMPEPKPEPARPASSAPAPAAPEATGPVPNTVVPPVTVATPVTVAEPREMVPVAAQPAAMPAVMAASEPPQLEHAPARFNPIQHPIDRKKLREQGLIVPEGTVTGLMEEFRIVKRQLLLQAMELRAAGAGAAAQRVLICSPLPGEGKTYCATNLALAIAAEKESEVVLVDADIAKPSILSTLGLPGGPGLMDALIDPSIDVANCVVGTDVPGLWVLPAGDATNSDTEYLASSRTRSILDRLTDGAPHRIVIFDSPPALAASPAAELAKYVGQAVVVARADKTGQSSLEDAIALLSGCPNIQLLLNAARFSPSGRRFGSYYGYRG